MAYSKTKLAVVTVPGFEDLQVVAQTPGAAHFVGSFVCKVKLTVEQRRQLPGWVRDRLFDI